MYNDLDETQLFDNLGERFAGKNIPKAPEPENLPKPIFYKRQNKKNLKFE